MNETNAGGVRRRSVEIVVPVHNEAHVLADSIGRLHAYLETSFPFPFRITIADNVSTDGTWQAAAELTERLPHVHAVHLEAKGRGRALKHVWSRSTADVVACMDVERGPKREFISRSCNLLLRLGLAARYTDAQCGFKAVRTDVFRVLAPPIEDTAWFFDTELLVLAQRNRLRIDEVPVDWVDDPDSRVDSVRTTVDDLKGMGRMLRSTVTGRARVPAVPRRSRAPQVPAARTSAAVLPVGANTHLEYAS